MKVRDICRLMQKIDLIEVDFITQEVRTYHSRIEEINENSIFIAEPYSQGTYLPRKYQKQYTVRVAQDQCAYIFKTKLLSYINNPIPLWVIAFPVDVRRNQIRGFVRLNINIDVNLNWMRTESEQFNITTLTKDISSNGIGVILEKKIPIGTKLKVGFFLETGNRIEVEGEVVRIIPMEMDYEKYVIGINFINIAETTKQNILKYIFKKQIERRKKEAELFG